MTPGDSDEYSEDDDSEYNEDHYRLSQPRSDALGETWHVLDAQGLQNPEFTGGPSICTVRDLLCRLRTTKLQSVRRLRVTGTGIRGIADGFPNLRALVLTPGDAFDDQPWFCDLSPLAAFGTRLHHLELYLPCFKDDDEALEDALQPLSGLRHLSITGPLSTLDESLLRVAERMPMLEALHLEAEGEYLGGGLDLSNCLHLRSLSLCLSDDGPLKFFCDDEDDGGDIHLLFPPHLLDVRLGYSAEYGSEYCGYTKALHDALVATGATVGPQKTKWRRMRHSDGMGGHFVHDYPQIFVRGPWLDQHAKRTRACMWWIEHSVGRRLLGMPLLDDCVKAILSACRLAPESELREGNKAWVSKELATLEQHRARWRAEDHAELMDANTRAAEEAAEKARLQEAAEARRREEVLERELARTAQLEAQQRAAAQRKPPSDAPKAPTGNSNVCCGRTFGSARALMQHRRDSSKCKSAKQGKQGTKKRKR